MENKYYENLQIPPEERHRMWSRDYNVVDKYKDLTKAEIIADLRATAFPYAVLMECWEKDFNLGCLIRSANAFNAKEVFYLSGRKRYDRRAATGSYHYTPITWLDDREELIKLKEKYTLVAIDCGIPEAVPLSSWNHIENSLFIFGSESLGISPETLEICDYRVYISMFGSVRSLNAAASSSIVMNDFVTRFKL